MARGAAPGAAGRRHHDPRDGRFCRHSVALPGRPLFIDAGLGQPREYGVVRRPPDGYWVPRYYGAPVVVVAAGLAPVMPRPPLFLPVLVPTLVRPGIGLGGGAGGSALRIGGGGGDSGKAL